MADETVMNASVSATNLAVRPHCEQTARTVGRRMHQTARTLRVGPRLGPLGHSTTPTGRAADSRLGPGELRYTPAIP